MRGRGDRNHHFKETVHGKLGRAEPHTASLQKRNDNRRGLFPLNEFVADLLDPPCPGSVRRLHAVLGRFQKEADRVGFGRGN